MNKRLFIDKIIEKQSLDIFAVGCEKVNFGILNYAIKEKRIGINHIRKKYGLSPMPANRRINMMANAGLLQRINRKRDIIPTALAIQFLKLVSEIKRNLKNEVYKKLEAGEFSL